MLVQSVVFLVGLVVLYFGAEWLVRAASSIARRFGIRPMVTGLTVVALGTSMPEFLLNFFAVFEGEDSLAIGNIIGSNIANIGLILGLSAVLMPLAVDRETLRKEYPMMVFVTLLFYALAFDGVISRYDGVILVLGLLGFMIFVVIDARRHFRLNGRKSPDKPAHNDLTTSQRVLYLLIGIAGLSIGARMMVVSAVEISHMLEIDTVVIGLTVVAIGTSLPEMAASVMCAIRKDPDMSIGNVLGSNMLNILFVVGVVSIIKPVSVDTASITLHFPVMIAFTVILFPIAGYRYNISRIQGAALLTCFALYLVWVTAPFL
jgi:cation:H+ antiporter